MDESFYQWQNHDLILRIKVQPKASKDEIAEILGQHLKIRITAAPVDGKANQHLITFLAKKFGVSKANIELLSGNTGREIRVLIKSPVHLPAMIHKD